MDKAGGRPLARFGDSSRRGGKIGAGLDRGEERRQPRFALAAQHAIDGAPAMLDDRRRDKGRAVPADADDGARQKRLRRLGEVDDLRDVGEVVARKGDDIRPEFSGEAQESSVALDLQIDQPDLVAGRPRRGGDELQPQRLQPQEDFRVHQRAGMDAEDLHARLSPVTVMLNRGTIA